MKDILQQINAQYSTELSAVQTKIHSLVQGQSSAEVQQHMGYVASKSGHMLRPLLTLIIFGAIDGRPLNEVDDLTKEKLISIAVALELLHTASLVHDDVIDHTDTRRKQPTINSMVGNNEAILIGNLFYLNAFRLMLSMEDPWYLEVLIQTAEAMCVGEVLQNEKQDQLISTDEYLEIVEKKTGALICAAASLSARLAGATIETAHFYESLALNLGTLYQLKDDYADQDLNNYDESNLQQLILERQQKLKEASSALSATAPHQQALVKFIHYFKG
jgi:geranylgeranyl pyrophosphate synthase